LESDIFTSIRERARSMGFSALSAAPIGPVGDAAKVRAWVEQGYHADMAWFERNLEKRLDPRLIMPEARSMWVLTAAYRPRAFRVGALKVSSYAAGDDYHDVLKKKARRLCEWVTQRVPSFRARVYVDTGPVLERYWGQEAGLGWIGKNANLIHRKMGSTFFIVCILTNADVSYGRRHRSFCGSCTACLDACPTGAIRAPQVVDSTRCISYLTIEHRGEFQQAPAFANWIFGCDICQEVCPWTAKFASPTPFPEFKLRREYRELDGDALLAMSQEQFSRIFRKSVLKRAKLAGLQRNIRHARNTERGG